MLKKSLYLLFIILLLEFSCRIFFYMKWDVAFFKMENILFHYYPELKGFEKMYAKDTATVRLLVLGGSAVNTHYSNLEKQIPLAMTRLSGKKPDIKVYNLAQYGQTTMDSRVKMNYLKKYFFDYVFFYHAINDTRANNIPESLFDINYRHFDYYNEVYICERHPEKKYTVIPYTIDFIIAMLGETFNPQPKVPPYYIVMKDSVWNATYWDEGKNIKTAVTFKNNLNTIITLALAHKQSQVILFTYANYTPANYSLKKFYRKELDYYDQQWPTEIYGDPENVMKGIEAHNNITRSLKDKKGILFVDYALMVPHNKAYFNDICHPTPTACKFMSTEIARVILAENTKKKNIPN